MRFKILSGMFFALACTVAHGQSLLDSTFNPGTGAAGGFVESVALQSNGKILVCGNFTSFNGQPKSNIARLNSDGSVDTSFGADVGYWVRHMAVQTDGKIIVGGFFNNAGVYPHHCIARLNTNGTVDTSFDTGTGATGTLGVSITGNPDPFVFQVAIQPSDGKILITGNFTNFNGTRVSGLARLNTNGTLDGTFSMGSGLSTWGRSIQVLTNNQILVTGWFDNYNNSSHNRMALINPNGSPDNSFLPFFGDRTAVYTATKLSTGSYLCAGHSLNLQGLFLKEIERRTSSGSIDTNFVGYADEKIQCATLDANGKILLCGEFTAVDGVSRTSIARMNADGTLETTFSANVDNWAWMILPQPDGKILLSGGFSTVDGQPRSGIARFLSSTNAAPFVRPQMISSHRTNNTFSTVATTVSGKTYTLQYINSFSQTNWSSLSPVSGDGTVKTFNDTNATVSNRFYRIFVN
ncbi:MAG: hypothetical protein JWM68_5681 [Verrucomicrobiales bacterium]|nr:hypothetical protein [Verrucomicrobiales bacterium]